MQEFMLTERLLEEIQKRQGDPFSMAYELTKIYAGSGEPEADKIPTLFLDLFQLFETGVDLRVKAVRKAIEGGPQGKDKVVKEKKTETAKKSKEEKAKSITAS